MAEQDATTDPIEIPALPFALAPEAVPQTYTALRREMEWYARTMQTEGGFTDIAAVLAGKRVKSEGHPTTFADLYDRANANWEALADLAPRSRATAERALRLCVALEGRQLATHSLRKYHENRPGTSGTFYDMGRVEAQASVGVYRLTEQSVGVFANHQWFSMMFSVGHGRYSVAFPRDIDAHLAREYRGYLTPEEVRAYKAEAEAEAEA